MVAQVAAWLAGAGLDQYSNNFGNVTESSFLQLMMQDYSRFGVVDMEHKTKLYRLIKALNNEFAQLPKNNVNNNPQIANARQPANPQQGMDWQGRQVDPNADLLDLDAHDGDLLAHASSPTFQLSPVSVPKKPEEVQQVAAPIAEEADPQKIRVVVRKRPLNRKEKERGDEDVVDVTMGKASMVVNETKVKVDLTKYVEKHQFSFDEALDESVSNDQVYKTTVQPLIHTLVKNGKATCFAYGQTGSGKTFTMSPLPTRAAGDILRYLQMPQHRDIGLYVSCFEIYGNKVFDLLNQRKKLNILEDAKKKVVVVGLKEHLVSGVDLVQALIDESNTRRSVGSTAANADSSRSHSIMQHTMSLYPSGGAGSSSSGNQLKSPSPMLPQFALKRPCPDGSSKLVGKISFIDLAGSERGADTFDNNRQTRLEGAEINKSLLALKECIRALDADARHVPFRGSKLTAVLRDSFVGDQARTVMIANISPNSSSVEHTLNTLRYADRVKELRKEKAERAPGGVTPGDNPGYYASVLRGTDDFPELLPEEPVLQQSPRRERSVHRPPTEPSSRPASAAYHAPIPAAARVYPGDRADRGGQHAHSYHEDRGDGGGQHVQHAHSYQEDRGDRGGQQAQAYPEDEMMSARDELMNTILEEEEDLVTAHRCQIEKTMEVVRQEMVLLQEVDQPGSQIDQYVERLEVILQQKAADVRDLQGRLVAFKAKLKEEEIMSKSVGPKRWGSYGGR